MYETQLLRLVIILNLAANTLWVNWLVYHLTVLEFLVLTHVLPLSLRSLKHLAEQIQLHKYI